MRLKCAESEIELLRRACVEPVRGLADAIVAALVTHRLGVIGTVPQVADVKARHASESVPHNTGATYTDDEVREWQRMALSERHLSDTMQTLGSYRSPRLRSFPPSGEAPFERARAEDVERVLTEFYCHPARPYASAGALYPVRLIGEVQERGLLGREPDSQTLVWRPLSKATTSSTDDPTLHASTARIWFVVNLRFATQKYGPRGYRYALIEAGEVAAFLDPLCGQADLDTRPFGGFDDQHVGESLALRDDEVVVHCIALRRRNPTVKDPVDLSVQVVRSGGESLHLATAWPSTAQVPDERVSGSPDESAAVGRSTEDLVGQAVDPIAGTATAKAYSELAERMAFVCNPLSATTSNGMAAHSHPNRARLNALLELYERHCLLKAWFTQTSPWTLDPPRGPAHRALVALALSSRMELTYGLITDSLYGLPAVVCTLRARESGAILLGSAAATDVEGAASAAALEVAKSLLHRWDRRRRFGEPLLEPHRMAVEHVVQPWHHESYWANDEVGRDETRLFDPGSARLGQPQITDSVKDLMTEATFVEHPASPAFSDRHVFRALHPALVSVHFGRCTDNYRRHVADRLGVDPAARWPHPLG